MVAWISSIVGVVCLGVLIEIILPSGSTAKYIKGIFSIMVVLVIVAPLPRILSNNFDWKVVLEKNTIQVDNNLYEQMQNQRKSYISTQLLQIYKQENWNIKKIDVTLQDNLIYIPQSIHIYIGNGIYNNKQQEKIIEIAKNIYKESEIKIIYE